MIVFVLVLASGWLSLVARQKQGLNFSRPTVKGIVLTAGPSQVHTLYKDQQYEFGYCDRSDFAPCDRSTLPSLFVKDRVRECWIQITELSTENARLGKSFDGKSGVESDFQGLTNSDYAHVPIKIRGSKLLPDRVTFDRNNGHYRLDFNSQLNLSITLSYFWVSKTNLGAMQ
jgi:hypothetical protein